MIKKIRLLHLWLGTFFAPSIVFFAFTGALQIYSWHEATPGSSYEPPAWLVLTAQVHKKQGIEVRTRPADASKPNSAPRPHREGGPPPPRVSAPLKAFFFAMSIGLITTTLLGIYMAFKYNRDPRLIWGLLVAGATLPTGLAFL